MTKIIAFAGKKQSGKTTCSEFVSKVFSSSLLGRSKVYNFADPLKQDICINILGLTYDQCYGTDDDKNQLVDCFWEGKQLTAREVMQFVGTNVFRKMQKNVWASATIKKILFDKFDLAIVADCRFPNEVDAIKSAGGLVIKLTRNLYHSTHESELALDENRYDQSNFDLIVNNDNIGIDEQNQIILNFLSTRNII